ncbi:MAG: porin [Pseudomonadota bacterium]
MKKILLGSSALALAFATPAAAVDWEIEFGGYMEQHLFYGTFDQPAGTPDNDGFDINDDAEFFVNPSITLENGITFTVNLDFEGNAAGGVDEPALIIGGSFGRVVIGEDDLASVDVMITAPDVSAGLGINSGTTTAFEPTSITSNIGISQQKMTRTTFPAQAGDPVGITYFSPRFAGLQAGVSYARDPSRTNTGGGLEDINNGDIENIFGVGVNYTNSFGGVDIAAGAGYSTASIDGPGFENPQAYAFGLNIGFAGFTVGGSYGEGKDAGGIDGNDGMTFDVGVSYETGPWGVSFTYLNSEDEATDDEIDEFLAAVTYDFAKGIKVGLWLNYRDFDAAAGSANDVDGFVGGSTIRVAF